jgi:hypothetical protein
LWAAREPHAPLGARAPRPASAGERLPRRALFDAMLAGSEAEWAESLDRHRPHFAVIYETASTT